MNVKIHFNKYKSNSWEISHICYVYFLISLECLECGEYFGSNFERI
jgi:hypothetical protein